MSQEPYDLSQPFDAKKLMDGFELVGERQVPVDPDSLLGRAMAEARAVWMQLGYQPIDPETFEVEPISVELDGE